MKTIALRQQEERVINEYFVLNQMNNIFKENMKIICTL